MVSSQPHLGIEPSVLATNPVDWMEIPVGCAGLFRLPTDFPMEANMQANFLGSGLSTASYYRNKGVAVTAGDRFLTSPFMETRFDISTFDPYFTSRYWETLSRLSTEKPRLDLYTDTVLSSSGRYTNPTHLFYPSYPTYPGLMPRMPPNEGFSRTFPNRTVGVPPADNLYYDGQTRPNMYR
ncbi:hypothetical protein FCV25MIE_18390 [Fagus crenata]